ncbi:OLC1v1019219C1 [Oldenlandia corymbosa var. corymbosa]|uniref:OLC1v1019219C1 n=1 Tax=Oldenlandia corymbosa var. corymbosa TaxID=529605 RepID=A0AAV1EDD8_OLDCO|nr:OLC1v1019219C1 [Oldenlandia corymbosa var. corymbosa]
MKMDPISENFSELVAMLIDLKECIEKAKSGELRERDRLFFKPFYICHPLLDSLAEKINKLGLDWFFLNILYMSVNNSNAAQLSQEEILSVTFQKAFGVADEILRYLHSRDVRVEKFTPEKLHGVLSFLSDWQRKTDELIETGIRQGVKGLSKLSIRADFGYGTIWKCFSDPTTSKILWSFSSAGNGVLETTKLVIFYSEIGSICKLFNGFGINANRDVLGALGLFSDATSVILRIAVRFCNLWFNGNGPQVVNVMETEIVGLLQEIDPTNLEFLQLNLRFLKYSINSNRHLRNRCLFMVDNFCLFLLNWFDREDLQKDLSSLVIRFIENALEDCDQDMNILLTEMKTVLAEVAFFHRILHRNLEADGEENSMLEHMQKLAEIQAKICLLKAEVFLKQQFKAHNALAHFDDDKFSEVNMIFTSLRAFTKGPCKQGQTEFVMQSLVLAEEMANEISSLQRSLYFLRITSPVVKHSLQHLLFKVIFFKAESVLSELLGIEDTFTAEKIDQSQYLVEKLTYFKGIVKVMLANNPSDDEGVITELEVVVREIIILLSCSYLPDDKKFKEIVHSLPQLLDKVNNVGAKVLEIGQHLVKCVFPKTFELGFLDFLCSNIRELLIHDPESIISVDYLIEEVLSYADSFKLFLMKIKASIVELGDIKSFANHIMNVAYKLEYVVESIEVDGCLKLQKLVWLNDLLEDSRRIDRLSEVHVSKCATQVENLPQISSRTVLRNSTPENNDVLVDLVDEENVIVGSLIHGSSQRDVLSIVGMPGIGQFEVLTSDIIKLTDHDLMSKLRRTLLRNKYLVVLDDIWDIAAWNDLEKCFPDDSNGSRILITSRNQNVISKIKPDSEPHLIRKFSDAESWKLLQDRIFKGSSCPEELLDVGMEIAQHCQGLPLAVVAIAGILQKLEYKKDLWGNVLKSLRSEIISNSENRCMEILELSYKHLPPHLRACFIYLGVFPQDKDIPVSKLMYFWMAEGFIQEAELKSLEDVAEEYLMELINRSLVNIDKTRSNGKVKSCRLHDLLHDMCRLKAKEENFHQFVTTHDEPYASIPDSEYDMEFDSKIFPAPVIVESYRVSFNVKRRHFINSRPSDLVARSLTFFAFSDSEPKCPYDISFICHNFISLRVLDLESIMAISFPLEVGQMIQLRYLAISGYMQSIPPSISNLRKLETLVVKGTQGKVILPETIWSMTRLRHLHVDNHVLFDLQDPDEDEGSLFIWKIYGTPDSGDFVLPESLKKLTLSNFCLQENHLSVIAQLPNLGVLKLHAGDFEGQKWEMQEDEFKDLKFLELDTMNLVEWNASNDHLPSLEHLVLRNCKDLRRIPSDFAYIATLQKVEVHWCGQSMEASAEEIGDEIPEIKVIISCL